MADDLSTSITSEYLCISRLTTYKSASKHFVAPYKSLIDVMLFLKFSIPFKATTTIFKQLNYWILSVLPCLIGILFLLIKIWLFKLNMTSGFFKFISGYLSIFCSLVTSDWRNKLLWTKSCEFTLKSVLSDMACFKSASLLKKHGYQTIWDFYEPKSSLLAC